MQIEQLINVIDAHTTGTPIRIVVGGIPLVSCADIHLTGFNQLFLEKDDKLKYGFTSW